MCKIRIKNIRSLRQIPQITARLNLNSLIACSYLHTLNPENRNELKDLKQKHY